MQSHTFSRSRGVSIICNGQADNQPSTSCANSRKLSTVSEFKSQAGKRSVYAGLPPTFVPRFHDERAVRRMPYRRLGSTEMVLSVMGLGSAALAGLFGDVQDSITAILETAIRRGVNLIDTAFWYGQARSELILGKALSKIPRRAYYIATKVGRFELDFARSFDFRADRVLESLSDSLKRLNVAYVDICFVQIHDIDFDPRVSIVLYETLQALEMAKASGKIQHIGLTGYPLQKLRSVIESSPVRIDVVMTYCHGTLNDNSLGEFIPFFQKSGVAVLNASPLSMGLLTNEGPPPWHPASQRIKDTVRAAIQYVQSKKMRIERLALDYSLRMPGPCACVVGCSSITQLEEALIIAYSCNGHSPTSLSELEQRVRDRVMRRYLDGLENAGWEGVDVAKYWRHLRKLGLPALATHRHSSVESLASTLNGFSFGSGSDLRRRTSGTHSLTPTRAASAVPISRNTSGTHSRVAH